MIYPAQFTPDTDIGGFVVTFRDIPEAITQGETWEDAVDMAEDALAVSMEFYFEDRRPVPVPSTLRAGETGIALPASLAAKVLLLNAMLAQDVSPAELARRLGALPQTVNRIINPRHATKIDTIDRALQALGGHLELSFAQAA